MDHKFSGRLLKTIVSYWFKNALPYTVLALFLASTINSIDIGSETKKSDPYDHPASSKNSTGFNFVTSHVLPDCQLRYDLLKNVIDVRQIINNVTTFEISNIGESKKMILGICKALPKSLRCEGKQTSTTSACLVDAKDNSTMKSVNNSQIIGTIVKSSLRLSDDRLYLESFTINKTCLASPKNGSNETNIASQIGVRIEFFCAKEAYSSPKYIEFKDCTYMLEWGSPLMCLNNLSQQKQTANDQTLNLSTSRPNTASADENSANSADHHKTTLEDATRMNEGLAHNDDLSTKIVPKQQQTVQSSSSDEKKASAEGPKMNTMHKTLMISLIFISFVAFMVVILILDEKTRLRVPIGSMRGRTRQVPQSHPVPYSRFVNNLDL